MRAAICAIDGGFIYRLKWSWFCFKGCSGAQEESTSLHEAAGQLGRELRAYGVNSIRGIHRVSPRRSVLIKLPLRISE